MRHPPSKTVGRKLWLAKAWPNPNALCPPPAVHLRRGDYSFSPANFDPRALTLEGARAAGRETTLFPPYGRLFGAQIWRMAHEAKIGDIIFLESENRHIHAWGRINAEYHMRAAKALTADNLMKEGLHQLGVDWHKVERGEDVFRLGRGDNLLFREVTKGSELYKALEMLLEEHPLKKLTQPNAAALPDLEYEEGGKQLRKHLLAERNPRASQKAKQLARLRSKDGKLKCESCRSVPEDNYNGLDIIEAHHSIPLANGARTTKYSDFIMLCPCCHRAVHKLIDKGTPPLGAFERLRDCFRRKWSI